MNKVQKIVLDEAGQPAFSHETLYYKSLIDDVPTFGGVKYARLDFNDVADQLGVVTDLITNGIETPEGHFWASVACSATKSGRIWVYDRPGYFWDIVPHPNDSVRAGWAHTPLYGGLGRYPMAVQIVDRQCYGLGDGQNMISPAFAAKLGIKRPSVVRGYVGAIVKGIVTIHDTSSFRVQKGSKYVDPDIVLFRENLKGEGFEDLPEFFFTEAPFGVQETAKRTNAKVGYQVTQFWGPRIWAEVRKLWPDFVKEAMNTDRLHLAKRFGKGPIRDEDGNVQLEGILAEAFQLGEQLPELINSGFFVDTLGDMMAEANTAACVSGGVSAVSLLATEYEDVPDGWVMVNPRDAAAGEYIAQRNPFALADEAVPVQVGESDLVPSGTLRVNRHTCAVSGLDMDGDKLQLIPTDKRHTRLWFDLLKQLPPVDTDKGRAPKQAIASHAEAIVMIAQTGIGRPANLITALRTAQLKGASIAPAIFEKARTQLRAAVDTAKRGSMPDPKVLADLQEIVTKAGVNGRDLGFVPFSNGDVTGWAVTRNPIPSLKLEKGAVPVPGSYMTNATFIGKSFQELGDQLHSPVWGKKYNGFYASWLPDGTGEGAETAQKAYDWAIKTMAESQGENGKEQRDEMFKRWCQRWQEYNSMKDDNWKENAAKRLWKLWTGSTSSKGYLMWHALPETLFSLLKSVKPSIAPATESGYIVGERFVKWFEEYSAREGTDIVYVDHVHVLSVQGVERQQLVLAHLGDVSGQPRRELVSENTAPIKRSEPFSIRVRKISKGRCFFEVQL